MLLIKYRRTVLGMLFLVAASTSPCAAQFGGAIGGYENASAVLGVRTVQRRSSTTANDSDFAPILVASATVQRDVAAAQVALTRPVAGEALGARLDLFVARLGRDAGCRIAIDEKALADNGIGLQQEISLSLGSTTTLRTALDRALAPHRLAWVFAAPGILITTEEQRDNNPDYRPVVFYPVYDLIAVQVGSRVEFDYDSLIDGITSLVRPDSWKEGGIGEGTIAPMPAQATLMVSQSWPVQEEVAAFLAGLRKSRDQQRIAPAEAKPSTFRDREPLPALPGAKGRQRVRWSPAPVHAAPTVGGVF